MYYFAQAYALVSNAAPSVALKRPAEPGENMPLARIDVRKGKDAAYRQKIGRIVYAA
jgi:hypothetical protein